MKNLSRFAGLAWMLLSFILAISWNIYNGNVSFSNTLFITEYLCLTYLFYISRSLRSRKVPLLQIGVGLSMIAILFKIMHWPFNNELLLISLACIELGYFIFFLRFTQKKWSDIFKLVWIISSGVSYVWVYLRLPDPFMIEMQVAILFLPMYLSVAISEVMGKSLDPQEDEEQILPPDIL